MNDQATNPIKKYETDSVNENNINSRNYGKENSSSRRKIENTCLDINMGKTKFMVIRKDNIPNWYLQINTQRIELVHRYTYLGTTINNKWIHCARD